MNHCCTLHPITFHLNNRTINKNTTYIEGDLVIGHTSQMTHNGCHQRTHCCSNHAKCKAAGDNQGQQHGQRSYLSGIGAGEPSSANIHWDMWTGSGHPLYVVCTHRCVFQRESVIKPNGQLCGDHHWDKSESMLCESNADVAIFIVYFQHFSFHSLPGCDTNRRAMFIQWHNEYHLCVPIYDGGGRMQTMPR